MAVERGRVISLASDREVDQLLADIAAAAERAERGEAGDRAEVVRFERLCSQLEQRAAGLEPTLVVNDARQGRAVLGVAIGRNDWAGDMTGEVRVAVETIQDAGRVPVFVLDALVAGQTVRPDTVAGAPAVAGTWASVEGNVGTAAVRERFRSRLIAAVEATTTEQAVVRPTGVGHETLTRTLREFVAADPGQARRDVAIEYGDGSRGPAPFPLRALSTPERTDDVDLETRFALMSIRHTEMDPIIDGAWLRNNQISRPRPHGLSDEMAYDISRSQLLKLTCGGDRRVGLSMYQSGFEPAVVGFYRAVVHHLLEFPNSLVVKPMFFRGNSRRSSASSKVTISNAPFVEGDVWEAKR